MKFTKSGAITTTILFMVSYCIWLQITKDDAALKVIGSNILQMIAPLLSAIWIYQGSCKDKANTFWFLLFAANLCYFIAQTVWNYQEILLQQIPSVPSVPDLFWILQYLCFFAAFLQQMLLNKKRYFATKTILEVIIVLSIAFVLSYEFIVEPLLTFTSANQSKIFVYMFYLYAISNFGLLLFTCILFLVLQDNNKVFLLLILGFLLKCTANSINLFSLAPGHTQSYFGSVVDPLWALGLLLIGLSTFYKDDVNENYLLKKRFTSSRRQGVSTTLLSVMFMFAVIIWVNKPINVVSVGTSVVLGLAILLQILEGREKRRASDALLEAEATYRGLVEESTLGVFILQDDRVVYANPRFAEIFGYSNDQTSTIRFVDLIESTDQQELQEILNRSLKGNKTPHHQFRGIHKDKSIVYLEAYFALTIFKGKLAITGTIQDITDRKRTEELLRKSDKLTLAGELAAGIAHEIRNPLTSLKGFVQFLESGQNYKKEYFQIMHSELDRINQIVNDFLTLAKPQVNKTTRRDLSLTLENVLHVLQPQLLLQNIEVKWKAANHLPAVTCDENQLKQLFINIIKNSMEAMVSGGILRIRVKHKGSNQVLIRILDHGTGIPEERIGNLGEPFYTTKEKGTGLGLMMCYKIVESHNGTITFQSKKGKGTIVDIVLPINQ